MTSITKFGRMALVLAVAVIAVDQATKVWILNGLNLPLRGSVQLAGPFHLTMVWNPGPSFIGYLLESHKALARWPLVAFSMTAAVVLALWVRRADRALFATSLGLVIGGAVGNALDRVRLGAVADFIDVSRLLYFPWVFNVADSAITVGICLLLVDMLRQDGKERAGRVQKDAS
jgi:signal peptidase II